MGELDRLPGDRRVAVVALEARDEVRERLACRDRSVVAASAAPDDSRVIEIRERPAACIVTIIARVRAGDVGGALAAGGGSVVAAEAGACDGAVVEAAGDVPGHGGVTVSARVCAGDVCGALAGGGGSVMAAQAVGVQERGC